jgi:hypothetical protein
MSPLAAACAGILRTGLRRGCRAPGRHLLAALDHACGVVCYVTSVAVAFVQDRPPTNSEMFWLSTVRRDGRPHVTPLTAVRLDGMLHFCAGSHEQKARNLQSNPGCVLIAGANQFRSGLDVVVEGTPPASPAQPSFNAWRRSGRPSSG